MTPTGTLVRFVACFVGVTLCGGAHAQDFAAAEALVTARGCTACHSLDGTPRVGPTFASATRVTHSVSAASGSYPVRFDVDYVRRAILEPDAELVTGHGAGPGSTRCLP